MKEREITPCLSGYHVKNKELFYKLSTSTNVLQDEELWVFDYLVPEHLNDGMVEFICDYHSWIVESPDYFRSFPVSKKMKEVLEKFNLYPNQFYKAKVLFEEELYDYFVWQQFLDGFDKFVNFEKSTFCEWDDMEKKGTNILQFKNIEEIIDYELEKEWWGWGFERAVMKPVFKEIDCMRMSYPYGALISERLKNALEAANLTGFEIVPFPVEFEYLE